MSLLGMQGISTQDTATDPQRRQELRDDGEFILLLSRHLLASAASPSWFHTSPTGASCADRVAHGPACRGIRLAIQGHMHMFLALGLPHQPTRFIPTALARPHTGERLREQRIDLLGISCS